MEPRFTQDHVDAWRRDGGVTIPSFFTAEECAAVVADFEKIWGRSEGAKAAADFNCDNKVNAQDFLILRSNYGQSGD